MRLTATHLAYWRERKATPSWWKQPKPTRWAPSGTSVDACINAHAPASPGSPPDDKRNTYTLIRSRCDRGETLADVLRSLHNCPASPRRKADCLKWLRRIA